MQKEATLTSKGQITIPREVRRALGLRTGDKVLFDGDGADIRVRPVRRRSAFSKYRGIGNPGIASGKKSVNKWLAEIRGK